MGKISVQNNFGNHNMLVGMVTFHCLVEIQIEGTVCGGGPGMHETDGNCSPEQQGGSPRVHQHPEIKTPAQQVWTHAEHAVKFN